MIDDLKEILHTMQCSLVVRHGEEVKTYNKKGVRDLWALLWSAPAFLRHSALADKVIGKAAAGIIAEAGVSEVYADVMSRLALPLLDLAGIRYTFGALVERIVIPEGDKRCHLERIVADAATSREVVEKLGKHFYEIQKLK
jgi:hypothetical protein